MKSILLFFIVGVQVAQAQIITTIAGTGTGAFSGDGGQATAAMINHPAEMAFDTAGNLYFSDYANYRLRKISPSGVITTIAGTGSGFPSGDGGPATAAGLQDPGYIAIKGTAIYFTENVAAKIRKIDGAGIVTTFAGNGISGYSGDGGPATAASISFGPGGIVFDRAGNLYLADGNNNRIRKIDTAGIITTIAGNGVYGYSGDGFAATAAQIWDATDIVIDTAGNIYFTEYGDGILRKVDTSGVISTFACTGTASFSGDGGPATAATSDYAVSLTLDPYGNMYFSEWNGGTTPDNRVRKINTAGIISTVTGSGTAGFGGDGGPATAGVLNQPSKVSSDAYGNIYIADASNNRLRKISASTLGAAVPGLPNFDVVMYPNPASDALNISASNKITQIIITNLLGQTVHTQDFDNGKASVDVSAIPPGIYFIKINGTEVRKFVKQ